MARTTASSNITYQQHRFAKIPAPSIQRSAFNRSFNYKTTLDSGYLYPIFVDEALPGDTINLNTTIFARMSTPIFPVMDNIYLDFFMFAVPNRLLWDNWKRFMGEQDNPADSTSYNLPQVTSATGGFVRGGLADYFGIPPLATTGVAHTVSALPFRAYNLIWNQWFRDENLQDSTIVFSGNGPDAVANYSLMRRGKRHDYFTSALPFAQKGTAVTLPLGTSAPVTVSTTNFNTGLLRRASDHALSGAASSNLQRIITTGQLQDNGALQLIYDPNGTLVADLSAATSATVNQLRTSIQTQRLLERDARGGTRYTELVRAHFGVESPDARQQRPEYLGGGTINISINPVPQTSSTTGSLAQGRLSAFGTGIGQVAGISKSFTEHCTLIGLVNIRADLNYQQGVERMWHRTTKYDFYWPALAHLGEQTILNREIYTNGTATDTQAFGYQERWAEYRYKPSIITGKFRSSDPQTLDAWHLAQNFASLPALNTTFIQDTPPMTRVMAVTTEPQFLLDAHFNFRHVRPMPTYSVPGLMDHF